MSCHDDDYAGQALASKHGVCYVAANYRLGVLGFLAHPALSAEDEAAGSHKPHVHGSGNYAMLDIIAALRWVQRHGRSFGGDANNVTIWGLSSGAQYVATLLVSPLAEGLFHRAMMQSCVDLTNVRELRARRDVWQGRTAEEWGAALGRELGCAGDDAAALEALRKVPAAEIVGKSWCPEANDCYEPCVDRRTSGQVVKPLTSLEALLAGQVHRLPVMIDPTPTPTPTPDPTPTPNPNPNPTPDPGPNQVPDPEPDPDPGSPCACDDRRDVG